MRLAGVQHFTIIETEETAAETVVAAAEAYMKNPAIGIIMIPHGFDDAVAPLRHCLREKKMTTPVIVTIPSGYSAEKQDVRTFYQAMTKRLIGFTIELGDAGGAEEEFAETVEEKS